MRIDIESVVVAEGGEEAIESVRQDELGDVRKSELVEKAAGAYSESYAPLPGWNNRSCICAV